MKKLPKIIGLIIVLTIAIIVISTLKLKHKVAPEGEFKNMVGAVYVGFLECKNAMEEDTLNGRLPFTQG